MSRDHPTDPDLLAYVSGHLTGSPSDEIETHLADCTDCANRIAAIPVHKDSFVVAVKQAFARRDSAGRIPIARRE